MEEVKDSIVNEAEKQEKNIGHRWQPGESGNPKGRPLKGHSITETIKRMMDEKPEIKKMLAAKILQMAADGDITAMKTLWNYIDGMPVQKNEVDVTQLPTPLLDPYVSTNNSTEETKSTE